MTEGTTVRGWLTESPSHAGYAAVGLLLLASWPFGGWEPAEVDDPSTTATGVPVASAPFTVSVDRAVAGPDLGPPFWPLDNGVNPGQADDQHVLLFLTVRNDSTSTLATSEVYRGLVDVRGLAEPVTSTGQPQAQNSLWSTVYQDPEVPQLISGLGPGLEYRLVLHQPVSGEVPAELEVDLYERVHRPSILDDTMIWTDGLVLTTVTVPVETVPAP